MPRPVKIALLCEDRQQACFVRRFLMKRGWTRHDIRVSIRPPGRGSAEQGVRAQFPLELRAYRAKRNHLRNGLIAVIDADRYETGERLRGLDIACADSGIDPPQPGERVLAIVPKRNIETWLAYLRGETVDESARYEKYAFESLCHPDADRLDAMCRNDRLEGSPPPSLERCCAGFKRFWTLMDTR